VKALCAWFAENARDLPWRRVDPTTGRRNPYRSLVSELMLQQTQVSRVVEKFGPFLDRFPTVRALAEAELADVLALWEGLGYYRRARHLHAAARAVVERHAGEVPRGVGELLGLPGVGRYTAGAVASIAFGEAAPIVDGNVMRVLLRVRGEDVAPDDAETVRWVWSRAEALVAEAGRKGLAGAFNEALMEHGATVCTPASPRCLSCPVRGMCGAYAAGEQERIPRPKRRAARGDATHESVIVRRADGRVLLERRGEAGLWAGLWQAPTLERQGVGDARGRSRLEGWLGAGVRLKALGRMEVVTTHRDVGFRVFDAGVVEATEALIEVRPAPKGWTAMGVERAWVRAGEGAGMGSAQRRVLGMGGAA